MDELFMFGISGISTFLLLLCRKKKYNMRWLTIIIVLIVVGCVGYLGATFGAYLSYGSWRGIRFYSKALFVTITLLCIAKIIKLDPMVLMDYYAPIDILALVVMKINCLKTGCCAGIELYIGEREKMIFPSQQMELAVATIIFVIIMLLEKKSKGDGYRYYIYLIAYGSTRFIFDYFRITKSYGIEVSGIFISVPQLFCLALLVFGIVGMNCIRKRKSVVVQR